MITRDGNSYRVQGPVTMANVTSLLAEGTKLFDHEALVVDLSEVEEVDSSAVSLMLQWMREAKQRNQTLAFTNLPNNLKSLATLYGVLDIIPQG